MRVRVLWMWILLALPSCARGCSERGEAPAPSMAAGAEVGDAAAKWPLPEGFEAAPLDGYVELAITDGGGCALAADGRVACWGERLLARGTDWVEARRPVFLPGVTDVAALTARSSAVCLTRRDGTALCWGYGPWGSEVASAFTPQRAPHLDGLSLALSPGLDGRHACGLAPNGDVTCWGQNASGQLGSPSGLGDFARTWPPTPAARNARALAAGARHTCAVFLEGQLACWGDAEGGALGDGSAHARTCVWETPPHDPNHGPPPQPTRRCEGPQPLRPSPVPVVGLRDVTSVAAAFRSTCAVAGGSTHCWGDKFGPAHVKMAVPPTTRVVASAAVYCVATRDREVWCWAASDRGPFQREPRRVDELTLGKELRVATGRACVLTERGGVRCWGRNASGLPVQDWTDAGPP